MHRLALDHQTPPLSHAETVLLVDDAEAQAVKNHVILEQGVGADHDLNLAGSDQIELFLSDLALVAAGQNEGRDADRGQMRLQAFQMLARQDFGRRHQGGLKTGGGEIGHGQHGHHRLARADIPLNQARHAKARGEVPANFVQGATLRARELEGKFRFQFQAETGGFDGLGRLIGLCGLSPRHGEVVGQKLVISEAPPRRSLGRQVRFSPWVVQGL